jgi:hypothetical protein
MPPRDSCKRLPQMSAIIERAGRRAPQLLSALPAIGRVELAVQLYPFSCLGALWSHNGHDFLKNGLERAKWEGQKMGIRYIQSKSCERMPGWRNWQTQRT